jgi:glyoxylase-like metal-dependent hydrolase (beta-lactamase superfamily II)
MVNGGKMRAWSIEGNRQSLDGGSMFGNAPRALWEQWLPPDADNRIRLACRGLLVTGLNERNVLFEVGPGAFFSPELRERYGIDEDHSTVPNSLSACGVTEDDIDAVVLSHLHFDHAGGLLSNWRDGRTPTLRFPRARYVVGEQSWDRARSPHKRDRASFVPELQPLLEDSGRLELVTGDSSGTLGDAVEFRYSDGHTPGLMLSLIGGDGGIAFCSDLVPGRPWVHLPITMGFDRCPEQLIDEKEAFLAEMLERDIRLVFTHDPDCALATLSRDERGRYVVTNQHTHVADLALPPPVT